MTEKIKILYIDDEVNNLIGFKAAFRFNYTIFTADKVSPAIELLKQHKDIRVILCDQRMPETSGTQFFEHIRVKYPLPIRILITGFTDIEAVISAINQGNIFKYIRKPWLDADIISSIDEANNFYLAMSMLSIKNQELEKAYTELDKFAYSVSHDLRGPLSGIAGAINVASDIDNLEEIKELLRLMQKSVEKLDNYITSMHDYYSLQRGDLKIADIRFENLAEELKDIYAIYEQTSNVNFGISVNQNEGFRSDEISIKLILSNLISNAFKYQKKEASVKSVFLAIEVNNGTAIITVADTGIGILDVYFGEIFNLFSRATTQEAGSGFGLYNVKGALLKLNGNIEVVSELNKGTTFKVTIPSK